MEAYGKWGAVVFSWWGSAVVRRRWWVLAATAVLIVVGGLWGTGVFGSLGAGGFDDPGSPSSIANGRIEAEFGPQGADILALYTLPSSTVDDPGLAVPVTTVLDRLRARPEIAGVTSYYTSRSPALVSRDRHATYVAIQLREGDIDRQRTDYEAVAPLLHAGGGVQTLLGGPIGFQDDANKQIERDIVRAEVLSVPILLLLMIFIFRGVVAAAMPLVVGVVATLGAFTVTRLARLGHRYLGVRGQRHHTARARDGGRLRPVRGEPIP